MQAHQSEQELSGIRIGTWVLLHLPIGVFFGIVAAASYLRSNAGRDGGGVLAVLIVVGATLAAICVLAAVQARLLNLICRLFSGFPFLRVKVRDVGGGA